MCKFNKQWALIILVSADGRANITAYSPGLDRMTSTLALLVFNLHEAYVIQKMGSLNFR